MFFYLFLLFNFPVDKRGEKSALRLFLIFHFLTSQLLKVTNASVIGNYQPQSSCNILYYNIFAYVVYILYSSLGAVNTFDILPIKKTKNKNGELCTSPDVYSDLNVFSGQPFSNFW